MKLADLAELGSQPSSDSIARARLLTPLDSASAKQGQTVEAVLAAPLFSPDRKLVLPEGTRLVGAVTLAKGARSFHRGGQLRFNFQKVELPSEVANLRPAAPEPPSQTTQATLAAAEGSGRAPIKVDSEGGVQAQESKTRFLAPAIALVLANKSADKDAGRQNAAGVTGPNDNVAGRTLGGGFRIRSGGHGAVAEFALRGDGVRILRAGLVRVLERQSPKAAKCSSIRTP